MHRHSVVEHLLCMCETLDYISRTTNTHMINFYIYYLQNQHNRKSKQASMQAKKSTRNSLAILKETQQHKQLLFYSFYNSYLDLFCTQRSLLIALGDYIRVQDQTLVNHIQGKHSTYCATFLIIIWKPGMYLIAIEKALCVSEALI